MTESSSVKTETYSSLGKCPDCGGDAFHVDAMVKTFAGVAVSGKTGNINIDDADFHSNAQTTDVILENADDMLLSGHIAELPSEVWQKMESGKDFNPVKYVVIRCDRCGKPFDYGDKQVVLGHD